MEDNYFDFLPEELIFIVLSYTINLYLFDFISYPEPREYLYKNVIKFINYSIYQDLSIVSNNLNIVSIY